MIRSRQDDTMNIAPLEYYFIALKVTYPSWKRIKINVKIQLLIRKLFFSIVYKVKIEQGNIN